jgi:hypothetical protein
VSDPSAIRVKQEKQLIEELNKVRNAKVLYTSGIKKMKRCNKYF